jgi:hypothetical protein
MGPCNSTSPTVGGRCSRLAVLGVVGLVVCWYCWRARLSVLGLVDQSDSE